MEVKVLKCPNCGGKLNIFKTSQKFTECKNCNALINLQEDDLLYNLEGHTKDYIRRADYLNEHHIYNEAFWEYRKAWCLDKNNEHVNYEMERCSVAATNTVKKRKIYEKIDDDMKGKAIKCPNCGNNLIIKDTNRRVMLCNHCRSSIVVSGDVDTYKEILDKVMYYYNEGKYDEALIELGELIIKDENNKYYQFLIAIISSLNKNYYNEIPIIDDRVKETFDDYYKSLNDRNEKSKAYDMLSDYLLKLYDIYIDIEEPTDEHIRVAETIIEFLKDIQFLLDDEELKKNDEKREYLGKLIRKEN